MGVKTKEAVEEMLKEVTITLLDSVHFRSGSAELSSIGKETLRAVAEIIKKRFPEKYINIEGHTDTDPVGRSGWKSNWELGAARSLSVLHLLIDETGFEPSRLSATTFSEYRPIDDNSTGEGKLKNRRAVVVILSDIPIKRVELKQ